MKNSLKNNKYIDIYINSYIKSFRSFDTSKYSIKILGLANFINNEDNDVNILLNNLRSYGFDTTLSNSQNTIDEILVEYSCEKDITHNTFEYRIENLISIIELSSKANISVVGILIMQIISYIICKTKTIYKAIILDLDDTVWDGTLAEEGIDTIKRNLNPSFANPFISFMRFVKAMSKELGLYIALCSRNDERDVLEAIEKLNEKELPIKGHIDCIVANYNDKSENIKAIAKQLSILTRSCVFIDDNQIIREEVKKNLPEVFVPEWNCHDDLFTIIQTCGIFDRFELSLKSRNRKRLYKVLQEERKKNHLPQLFIKTNEDKEHIETTRLYAKSNQFKFSIFKPTYENSKSLFFEIFRENSENLGVCSALTYTENEHNIHILNWAISCRYFEIGLEEYILSYIYSLSNGRKILFDYNDTGLNIRAASLIRQYSNILIAEPEKRIICFNTGSQAINKIKANTNLKEYCNG